ncbi:hypothetical protein VCRA2119O48_110091 [Vibrio crassostreae]|nr:hypothetical protein VCRA2119O48_110091 [Vibrio crassostreae]CAK3906601.1 hypothetical protein VCRA212O16_330031 [Vibrio crassostreae]
MGAEFITPTEPNIVSRMWTLTLSKQLGTSSEEMKQYTKKDKYPAEAISGE